MIRFCAVAAAGVWMLSFGHLAVAAVTDGPFEDYRGHIDPAPTVTSFVTSVSSHKGYNITDSAKAFYDGPAGFDMRGAMFITRQTPDFSGDLVFTTIYGFDPNPGVSELSVFGFDPVPIAAALNIFDERIFGDSGTAYLASVALKPTLAELPALLPGFDLSAFHGAPDSVFYLFQTTAPASDFTIVPEPSTLSLLVAGAVVALVARGRTRSHWQRSKKSRAA